MDGSSSAAVADARTLLAVVVTPNASDQDLTCGFLRAEGIDTVARPGVATLDLPTESIGCVLIVEEALGALDIEGLQEAVQLQPAWSDLPIVLIAAQATALNSLVERVVPGLGSVTVLQRPLHPMSLVSAVRVALRARRRQFQVLELLRQRERAVRQRDEFLAMLAHELRNPLMPIRNAVYLLGTLPVRDPLFVKCRDMIDKQARHITRLVDDLLDVSRLELGKVELRLQRVDIGECVASAVEACTPMTSAQRHRVALRRPSRPACVMADPVRLEQAVCNLIVNAAKFTPEGGAITVEAAVEGAQASIAVTDTGVGIRPEMLESIFELFTQSDVTIDRTAGGLGIGLTLVRRLVEMHGGEVRASSAGVGRGSRFEMLLPIAVGEAPQPARPAKLPVDQGPRQVLVIEDGDDNRDSLGTLVSSWKHEVFFASTGPEGVECAHKVHPDIVLIDIGLPGFAATKWRAASGAMPRHGRTPSRSSPSPAMARRATGATRATPASTCTCSSRSIRHSCAPCSPEAAPRAGFATLAKTPQGASMVPRLIHRICLFIAAAASLGALAQSYPSRPVTLVVPFSAGGPTDTIARIMAERMSKSLGQPIVVENVVGAGGTIANARVMKAAPDGYMLEIGHIGTHVLAPAVQQLNVDYVSDFDPVALIVTNPQVMLAKADVPAKTLKDLIAYVKANPGKVSYGTGGAGTPSHIMGVYFGNQVGAPLNIVHYKGAAPAMQDVIAGHVDLSFDQAATALTHLKGGRVKAFAVTSKTRLASAPDIPTTDEAGMPGFYMTIWHGIWVPKGTPKDVVAKLNAAAREALADAGVKKKLEDIGQEIPPADQQAPEFLRAHHKAETDKWWPLIKQAGIKAN